MAHAPPTPEVRTRPATSPLKGTPRPQNDLVEDMVAELGDQNWEFTAAIIMWMLSPKVFRGDPGSDSETKAYPPLDSFDCLVQADGVPSIMASMPTPPEINFVPGKNPNFPLLAAFLNSCITNCDEAYRALVSAQIMFRGSALQPQDRRLWPDLEFRVYDRATKDGVQGAGALKPGLVGVAATMSARPACYWTLPAQSPKDARKILIPVEVGGNWPEIVGHAGTYARAQVNAVPLRLFSLVIGVNYESRSLRFLIYHRGGLTASHELMLDEPAGRRHVQEILFSIVLWQSSEDAGFPSLTNGIETLMPSL
ncbi:hypothetical protein C8Q74DRAFT_1421372 [Fomes fomentarius]|nr:hypothetical protein C8Q74DRAFT_1421372 [Fomes fomentarius]